VKAINRLLDQEEGWDARDSKGWSATRRESFEASALRP